MINNNSQKGFAIPIIIAIIALVVIIIGVGYFALTKKPVLTSQTQQVIFASQEECEQKTGGTCKFEMCDYIPEGITPKEACPPNGPYKGWVPGVPAQQHFGTEDEAIMVKYTGTVLAGKSAPLLDYNKADYNAAVKSDKLVVLYFYANWCPICKVEFPQAQAAFDELTTDKVVGFRVNYKDNETDADEKNIARELGVPYQHTKVFLKNGKQVLKAPDSWNKMRYLDEINKAITQ